MAKLRDFTLLDPRAQLDKGFYDGLRAARPHYRLTERFVIPPYEGRGFIATKGQVFRVIEEEGVQIGDISFWNARTPKEMYSLSRTWAIEGWAVRRYTRIWSDVPWLPPLATCIYHRGAHSLAYLDSRVFYFPAQASKGYPTPESFFSRPPGSTR
jgi:uncharacterized protein YcgI (DUF1989 family)